MDFQLIPTAITCSVQIVTCGLTYLFGRRSAKIDSKKAILRERYDKFYIPFVRLLYKGFYTEGFRPDIPFKTRAMMHELLSNNLEYLDVYTLRLYPSFYKAFLDMLEYEDGNHDFDTAPEDFLLISTKIALTVLQETQRIAKELTLPPLGQPLIGNYLHSLSKLRKLEE
ncbi:MAG: hypothetical protein E7202_06815 [Selenomonas ruminantium]|jgi:hypothetical protein|nr:hypothetical protein [Selenomonas ruminantium]